MQTPFIAGIILAAGASTRMGHPKSMLRFADGMTLLARQFELLQEAGIKEPIVVAGAMAADIRAGNMDLEAHWVINEGWEHGQFSSLQAGLSAAHELCAAGAIILPIDVVGVSASTIRTIIRAGVSNSIIDAVIPKFAGSGGHPIYLSSRTMDRILDIDPDAPGARLDIILRKTHALLRLPVADPRVADNVNTPDEWRRIREQLDTSIS